MNRLGIILLLVFAAIVLAWGGFIAGRGWHDHMKAKCVRGFSECLILLEQMEGRLNECRLKLPRED